MFGLLKDKVSHSSTFPGAKLIQLEGGMFECSLESHQHEQALQNRTRRSVDDSLSGQAFRVDDD